MGKHHKTKVFLAVLPLVVLLFPYLQKTFGWFEETELKGYHVPVEEVEWTWEGWTEGTYQSRMDSFTNQEFGLRKSLVRLNNQLDWTIHRKTNAVGIVAGKEDYLYEEAYITAYLGRDYHGRDTLELLTQKMKRIQDLLAQRGTDLCVVFAPGKASFFPEYIPDRYQPELKSRSNYDEYVDLFAQYGVNFVDMDAWFTQMKGKTKAPLFPQGGTHWSYYGAYLASDSLIHKAEELSGNDMPELKASYHWEHKTNYETDYDIGEALNLIWRTPTYPMVYPKYYYQKDSTNVPTKTLVISDSYYWQLFLHGMSHHAFSDGEFWYYNQGIHPKRPGKPGVQDVNAGLEMAHNEVVFVLITVANLRNFPWKMDQGALDALEAISPERIAQIEAGIRRDEAWMAKIAEKAAKRGFTTEEMLRFDAEFIAGNEWKEKQEAKVE